MSHEKVVSKRLSEGNKTHSNQLGTPGNIKEQIICTTHHASLVKAPQSQFTLFNLNCYDSAYYSALEQTAPTSFPHPKQRAPTQGWGRQKEGPYHVWWLGPRAALFHLQGSGPNPGHRQGRGECTQLNVIYHILAPRWPMWKELANPHIALIFFFKKNLNIYPFISQLGKRNSCVVPVGIAVRSCTFSVGHTLERAVSAVPGSSTPQGGEWECPFSSQLFTFLLSCSPLQSADIPRKICGLLNSKRAENKGLLQLAKEMEYFAQVSIWSCSSQECLCWPDPMLPKRCGLDPS